MLYVVPIYFQRLSFCQQYTAASVGSNLAWQVCRGVQDLGSKVQGLGSKDLRLRV